jgi:regulator of protease activity HflC (stomatin/prohibitin superfamily)
MTTIGTALTIFLLIFLGEFVLKLLGRVFGLYTIVQEGTSHVFVLFGRVLGVIQEPGLHILPFKLGPAAFVVNLLGKAYTIDTRLDQEYVRSQPVNSEEGAPMGVGVWYEMWISDPVDYLFKNTDPRGSLRANVSNSTVRCLSNMPLGQMLCTRHEMSQSVRTEVSGKSQQWGYRLGSVYIRKVHFRDLGMIRQIEEKVVNRLRQVTSAIRQAGANQVSVITSSAEREAAVEFARAAAIRPATLRRIFAETELTPEVSRALFEILEAQRITAGHGKLYLLPAESPGVGLAALLKGDSDGSPMRNPQAPLSNPRITETGPNPQS